MPGTISKKCPECKGCMEYQVEEGLPFLWCDLCQKTYIRVPGGELTLVDNREEMVYNKRNPKWKSIDRSKDKHWLADCSHQ
jgi:hypothetical protein